MAFLDRLVFRRNNVPHFQRLFQLDKPGVPIYLKSPRSKAMLYPFFTMFGIGLAGSFYGLGKMALDIKD